MQGVLAMLPKSARIFFIAATLAIAGLIIAGGEPAAAPPATSTPAAVTNDLNLTSYANGAWILKKPAEYDESWSAFWLLDERSFTGWATPQGNVAPQEVLIALAEESVIRSIEFDSGRTDGDAEGSRSAKDIVVEVSNQGPASGFTAIATVSLKAKQDQQRFTVSRLTPARWVKLTIKNNHGSAEYIELFDFRAIGEQKTRGIAWPGHLHLFA